MNEADRALRPQWWLLAAAIAWLAFTAWLRPLTLPDEGRYATVAWEMVRSGDWVTPTLDGLPYFHKPPLFYWITAASISVFGMSEWPARVAPLAGGVLAAAALYLFALRHAGREVARAALLVFATIPMVFIGSQFANLDMLVAGCIAATILAAAHAVLVQGRGRDVALVAAYGLAALGVLAKGLIGAVLPGMVIVAWVLLLGRPRELLALLSWKGAIVFFAIAAPWLVANELRFPGFAHYFIVVQHFSRFAQTGFNNAQPAWFLPVVIALAALPWSPWLVPAAKRRRWGDAAQGPVRKLMWAWLVLITLFFSLPQSKLVGYILPVTVPLAFLVADVGLALAANGKTQRNLQRGAAVFAVVVCVGIAVAAAVFSPRSHRAIGLALRSQATPTDTVIFLHDYLFDVSFYGRLRQPIQVIEHWDVERRKQADNWHRELLDAAEFDPRTAQATRVFAAPSSLGAFVCEQPVTWVIGQRGMTRDYPLLGEGEAVSEGGGSVLWRLRNTDPKVRAKAGCDARPLAAGSAG